MGWSSCFLSAVKLEAAATKVRLPAEIAVDAEVDLGATAGQYFLQARLNVSLPGIDRQTAQSLVDGAHRRCPYSKCSASATRVDRESSESGGRRRSLLRYKAARRIECQGETRTEFSAAAIGVDRCHGYCSCRLPTYPRLTLVAGKRRSANRSLISR